MALRSPVRPRSATCVSTRSSDIGSSRTPGLPAGAERLGDGAERIARAEHLRTDDVGGEVAVAEAEPLGSDAVRRELLLDREGLVRTPPALLLVDATAEGVHHGVEVGADLQPEQMDVVTGVADDRDVRVGRGLLETAEETGAADAAGQNHNAHADSLSASLSSEVVVGDAARELSGGVDVDGRPGEHWAAVHRHLGQAREVDVQADGRLERVVDDLVHVAGREHPLRAGGERPRRPLRCAR